MKSKLLPISLVVLIVLNGVLIFMLLKKPHEKEPHKRSQRNFLTEQLQFSIAQKEQFRDIESPHRDYMQALDAKMKNNKELLFRSFSKMNFSPDSVTTIIGNIAAKKEAEVFHFFQKVRNLCNENQLNAFDDIIMKALRNGRRRFPQEGRMLPQINSK